MRYSIKVDQTVMQFRLELAEKDRLRERLEKEVKVYAASQAL